MRQLIPALILILGYLDSSAQLNFFDEKTARYNFDKSSYNQPAVVKQNNVWSEAAYIVFFNDSIQRRDSLIVSYVKYDSHGYPTSITEYWDDQLLLYNYDNFYTATGISKREYNVSLNKKPESFNRIVYNDQSQEELFYHRPHGASVTLIYKKDYNRNGSLQNLWEFNHSVNRYELAASYDYTGSDNEQKKVTIYPNRKGKGIEPLYYFFSNRSTSETISLDGEKIVQYEYDKLGRCITKSIFRTSYSDARYSPSNTSPESNGANYSFNNVPPQVITQMQANSLSTGSANTIANTSNGQPPVVVANNANIGLVSSYLYNNSAAAQHNWNPKTKDYGATTNNATSYKKTVEIGSESISYTDKGMISSILTRSENGILIQELIFYYNRPEPSALQ